MSREATKVKKSDMCKGMGKKQQESLDHMRRKSSEQKPYARKGWGKDEFRMDEGEEEPELMAGFMPMRRRKRK